MRTQNAQAAEDEADRILDDLDPEVADRLFHRIKVQLLQEMAPEIDQQITKIREDEARKARQEFQKDTDILLAESSQREGLYVEKEAEVQRLTKMLANKDKALETLQKQLIQPKDKSATLDASLQEQASQKLFQSWQKEKQGLDNYTQTLEEQIEQQAKKLAHVRAQNEAGVIPLKNLINEQSSKITNLLHSQQELHQVNVGLHTKIKSLELALSDHKDELEYKSEKLSRKSEERLDQTTQEAQILIESSKTVDPKKVQFHENGAIAQYLRSADAKTLAKTIDRNMKVTRVTLDQNVNQYYDLLKVMPSSIVEKMHNVGQELQKRLYERMKFSGKLKQGVEDFGSKVVNAFSKLFGKKVDDPALKAACEECHTKITAIQKQNPNSIEMTKFIDNVLSARSGASQTAHKPRG